MSRANKSRRYFREIKMRKKIMKINRGLIEKRDSQATGKGANEKKEGWGACATVKQMLPQKAFHGTQGDRGGGRSSSRQD